MSTETKPCEKCGIAVLRNSRAGQRDWDRKRFCSNRCRGLFYGPPANAPKGRQVPLSDLYQVASDGCWNWTGHISADGYGKTRMSGGPQTNAHRVMWTELVGPIPEGLTIDHLCRNRRCVNPAHLEPVTIQENIRRGVPYRASHV